MITSSYYIVTLIIQSKQTGKQTIAAGKRKKDSGIFVIQSLYGTVSG